LPPSSPRSRTPECARSDRRAGALPWPPRCESQDELRTAARPVRHLPPFTGRRDPSRLHVPPVRAIDDRSAVPTLPEPAGGSMHRIRAGRRPRVQWSRFLRQRGVRALVGRDPGLSVPDPPCDARSRRLRLENGTIRPEPSTSPELRAPGDRRPDLAEIPPVDRYARSRCLRGPFSGPIHLRVKLLP
jgi:hypothetical protein